MKQQHIYEKFIADDFQQIKEAFKAKGFDVVSAEDFCTYQGWLDKGRKVKNGKTALKLVSSKPYPKPIYVNRAPQLDDRGRTRFGNYYRGWSLFHKEETIPINDT